jgi:hypothetical protein
MWRALAAGVSVILAAVSGVVTALVTTHPTRGLWVALVVVAIVGAALQAVATCGERRAGAIRLSQKPTKIEASGPGAVAIGGSAHQEIHTHVHGSHPSAFIPDKRSGVAASGPGAVAIGGNAAGPISTNVTSNETKQHDY